MFCISSKALYDVLSHAEEADCIILCSVNVASSEGAVLSPVSDTTASKTCLRKACHDPPHPGHTAEQTDDERAGKDLHSADASAAVRHSRLPSSHLTQNR